MTQALSGGDGIRTKKRTRAGSMRRATAMAMICLAALFTLASCVTPFDMSGERITAPGPEWGVVIGSVLVQPEMAASGKNAAGHDVSGVPYAFDIVQIQPADPDGEDSYASRYRLTAMAGVERMFISRLRPGDYLIRGFHEEGVTGLGGELNLVFTATPGEVRYIGRVRVEIPRRVSSGKGYRFTVENARGPVLEEVSKQYVGLAEAAEDRPMQARAPVAP